MALLLSLSFGLALLLPSASARADIIEVKDARLEAFDEGWTLQAEFGLELSARLEEAINRGVPLYFNFEFELTRPRWYWLDEKAAQASQTYKLSYHALTQSYRLSAGSLYQSFPTLKEALRLLARPRMTALTRQQVRQGETYVAHTRLILDAQQLPKAFQINALTSREWTLESEWKKIPIRPDGPGSAPAAAPSGGGSGAGGAGAAGGTGSTGSSTSTSGTGAAR